MERWMAKVIAIVVTFTVPFIATVVPYPMSGWIQSKGKSGERMINRLMCYGGGIFFGTFLLHIGPEVRERMETYLLQPNGIHYPLTDLIIGFGFLFTLFFEKVCMRINKRQNQARKERNLARTFAMCQTSVQFTATDRSLAADSAVKERCAGSKSTEHGGGANSVMMSSLSENCSAVAPLEAIPTTATATSIAGGETGELATTANEPINLQGLPNSPVFVPVALDKLTSSAVAETDVTSVETLHHHHGMRSLILILALSLHHVFEGLSLGLQSSVSRVFTLLIALMCHETIIGFSLGLQFVKCSYSLRRVLATAGICSIVLPIGVAAGVAVSEVNLNGTSIEIVNGVLQSFAAGTFIFVTFLEILHEELDPDDSSFGKVLSVAAGFVTIALLGLVPDEHEQHPPSLTYNITLLHANAVY